MELRKVRQDFRSHLSGLYPDAEVDAMFYVLIQDFLGLPRHILGLEPQVSLSPQEFKKMYEVLDSLKSGQPLQYVTGRATFLDMDLAVGPGVLIPRPETEELVQWIRECHNETGAELRVLDVGTGSGCIAIGLKKMLPEAEVHGLDRSHRALFFAQKNAESQHLNISWHLADMQMPGEIVGPFDLIVSNPPYIPESEAKKMHTNVRDFEPSEALFVPDEDPLLFYKALMGLCGSELKTGGWLYLEIHENFGDEVEDLLCSHGFEDVHLKKDIFGKPRFVRGKMM